MFDEAFYSGAGNPEPCTCQCVDFRPGGQEGGKTLAAVGAGDEKQDRLLAPDTKGFSQCLAGWIVCGRPEMFCIYCCVNDGDVIFSERIVPNELFPDEFGIDDKVPCAA